MNYTREQIEQMPAGPQMDLLIATEIFKARKPAPEQTEIIKAACYQFTHYGDVRFIETLLIEPLPQPNRDTGLDWAFLQPYQYSTRIDAAWQLVEKVRARYGSVRIEEGDGDVIWTCRIATEVAPSHWRELAETFGETAPLAICRAALVACLESKGE
jgi:hypothetical protein